MKQVNATYDFGRYYFWVSEYCIDGYVGTLTDCVAVDDCQCTNWCVFTGTQQECEEFINTHKPEEFV